MEKKRLFFYNEHRHYRLWLLVFLLASCTYHPPFVSCEVFVGLLDQLDEVKEQERHVVFEQPGSIMVMHGSGCAHNDGIGVLKVEQSLELPRYANKATVFLNGWKTNYQSSDHHVLALGTTITKIHLADGKLTWNAVGVLRDNSDNGGIDWCYNYTVIAWNDAAINAFVDDVDVDSNICKQRPGTPSDKFYITDNNGATTALSSFSSFIQNPNFPETFPVAVLPRGFGFLWNGNDHHLLQVAYNLDHSETIAKHIVEHGAKNRYKKAFGDLEAPLPAGSTRAQSGFVSWNTYAILKDNKGRRDYSFGEIVSALGGKDVGIIQPPFSVLPKEDGSGLYTEQGGIFTQDFVIENIPYEHAVPMLTGWELGYELDDEHVTEVGIWIDNWTYEKAPGALSGTLRYKLSSVLRDKNSKPGHLYRHKITVLGLRPTTGKAPL